MGFLINYFTLKGGGGMMNLWGRGDFILTHFFFWGGGT